MQRQLFLLSVLLCGPALLLAGPPLICHPIDIGTAKSLPWRAGVQGWDGADPAYDTRRVLDDTLTLLSSAAPLTLRMETLRRAAIYVARHDALAHEISARLLARTLDSETAGKPDPLAWFDAGYWAETLRQVTYIYRYDMLTPAERTAWKLRGDRASVDGYPWVRRAQQLAGARSPLALSMDDALGRMEEYRQADRKITTASTTR